MDTDRAAVRAVIAQQGQHPGEADLLAGRVVSYDRVVVDQGSNTVSYVVLDVDGKRVEAFHKTFSGVDEELAIAFGHEPVETPIHEYAAGRLARLLGAPYADMVPVAVLRDINGDLGALSVNVGGRARRLTDILNAHPDQAAAGAFFDSLIGQQDRHGGNVRFDDTTSQVGLIDHAFTFATADAEFPFNSELASWRWGWAGPDLSDAERATLTAVTTSADLFGLAGVLRADRVDALLGRARHMLTTGRIPAPPETNFGTF